MARPDKISGADINSICQEVSDGFCLDWAGVCVKSLPLETTLPPSFCPSLPPWVLGCVCVFLHHHWRWGVQGVGFNSYPLTERDVGCPRESLHCFGQGLRESIQDSHQEGRTGAWILQMTPLPKPQGLGASLTSPASFPKSSSLSSLPRIDLFIKQIWLNLFNFSLQV